MADFEHGVNTDVKIGELFLPKFPFNIYVGLDANNILSCV